MPTARWFLGAALILVGSIPVLGNWWFIACYLAKGERRLVIPLVGGRMHPDGRCAFMTDPATTLRRLSGTGPWAIDLP